jgi:hypothetical protein
MPAQLNDDKEEGEKNYKEYGKGDFEADTSAYIQKA